MGDETVAPGSGSTTASSPPHGDTRTPGSPGDDARRARRERQLGWLVIWAVTLGVLLTWVPSLDAALGDNHEGRIIARHALNVANAQQDGLRASGWLSDWSPYVGDGGEQTSYAHHPPLLNLVYYAAGQISPWPLDATMRLTSYLLGVLLLPAGAAVLLRRGVPWPATVIGTVAVAVTPLFWVYGRLHGNVTLLLVMMLLIVRVAEDRPIPGTEVALTAVASIAAIVAGYLGMAMAAVLGLWLLRQRGWDRVVVTVGLAMVVGAAISLGYVVGATGAARVGEQVVMRTVGGGFTATEFVARIAEWATSLLPWWWRWLVLPAALVAGVVERRTRPLTIASALVAVGYVVGLPNGSFIHDYWILPVLLPAWFGAAALASMLLRRAQRARSPRAAPATAAVLLSVLLVAGAVHGWRADVAGTYLVTPQAAGELVRSTPPGSGQATAWRTRGIAAPRWQSLYWDLPPGLVTAESLPTLADGELILVRRSSAPAWLGDDADLVAAAEEVRADYALVTAVTARRLAGAD